MGKLADKYRAARGKNEPGESRTPFGFKTGIDLLDYKNGRYVTVKGGKPYLSTGVDEGTYIMLIGKSGAGKTALALQMAANIVEPYENGEIYHDDIEAATDVTRLKAITGWDDDTVENKYIHRNVGITAETFYENVRKIHTLKQEMKSELTITTEKLDSKGRPIEILEPTVYILDSLAVLVPEKVADEDELSGGMSQTAVAKANSMIFQRILPLLKKSNIILIVINHINTKIEINPMVHTKAQVNYLKQDESIPGGNKPIYLANNIFKVDAGSKLTEDKEYGINGFVNILTIIKSRSNRAGQTMELIYDQNRGYVNLLSNWHFLKGEKEVGGAGQGFYLPEHPEVKFSQKNLMEKFKKNKAFRIAFKKKVAGLLKQFIYIPTEDEMEGGGDPDAQEEAPKGALAKKAAGAKTTTKTTTKKKK